MAKNPKATLRRKCDKLWYQVCLDEWGDICEYCENQPANQIHHFFRKSQYGHIRYDVDNGIPTCQGCHLRCDDPIMIDKIKDSRGIEWYNKLVKKAKDRPKGSYITIGWYRKQLEKLQKYETV